MQVQDMGGAADMTWEKLDAGTARRNGATNAEDVILFVCEGCSKGNLDFEEPEFCDVQAAYGFHGEHPAIQYDDTDGFAVRCTEYERA